MSGGFIATSSQSKSTPSHTPATQQSSAPSATQRTSEQRLVRTDNRATTLDSFVTLTPRVSSSGTSLSTLSQETEQDKENNEPKGLNAGAPMKIDLAPPSQTTPQRIRVNVRLTSVLELRQQIIDDEHEALTALLQEHTFVGVVNTSLALVQWQTKLFMVDYQRLRWVFLIVRVSCECRITVTFISLQPRSLLPTCSY